MLLMIGCIEFMLIKKYLQLASSLKISRLRMNERMNWYIFAANFILSTIYIR